MATRGTKTDPQVLAIRALSKETRRLADQAEKQNRISRRFLVGLVFGVGTAIGASVVATLIIFFLSQIISFFNPNIISDPQELQQLLEQQIEQNRPTE